MRILPKNLVACLLLLYFFLGSTFSSAADTSSDNPSSDSPNAEMSEGESKERKDVWSFGFSGIRYLLMATDDDDLNGTGGSISLGRGYIRRRWFLSATVDSYFGPYDPARSQQFNTDYYGVGATVWWGASAQPLDLRDSLGGVGVLVGFSFADLTGRNIGRNRRETNNSEDPQNHELERSFVVRSSCYYVIPGFFYTWLNDARPTGNAPALLRTRFEGIVASLGLALPLKNSYVIRVEKPAGKPEDKGPLERHKEKGQYTGYNIIFNITTFLGT